MGEAASCLLELPLRRSRSKLSRATAAIFAPVGELMYYCTVRRQNAPQKEPNCLSKLQNFSGSELIHLTMDEFQFNHLELKWRRTAVARPCLLKA